MNRLASMTVVVLVAGCLSSSPQQPDSGADVVLPEVPAGSVRFLVIGDYGNGDDIHYALGEAMLKTCQERGCQFVITVGDNIYGSGVRSPYDRQFDTKFEDPFAVFPLPFYLSLGNHDNGNGDGSNPIVGDYEVAYTYRTDRPSTKWNMPARDYSVRFGDVELFAIDSGPQEVSQAATWMDGNRGLATQAWLDGALAESDAPWKFVYAHHPYLSNGAHGNAGVYDNSPGRGLAYKQMLEQTMCGRAQVFFAGHDHDLEWLEPSPLCPGTELLLSGGAGHVRARGGAPDNPVYWEAYNTHGYLWVDVTGDTFTGVFVDFEQNVLYERSLQRSQAGVRTASTT